MRRKLFIPILITVSYYFIGIQTTTKNMPAYPCPDKIQAYFSSDTLNRNYTTYYMGAANDTILIRTTKDSMWNTRTSGLCSILKDSCQLFNRKILVVDTTNNPALFDTKYGRKVYFIQCP